MTRLVTVRVSQASAEQRARPRRPARSPGSAIGCGASAEQAQLPPYAPPEILEADLAPLALTLAAGAPAIRRSCPGSIRRPPRRYAQARTLLIELGALDAGGRITAHGKALAALPLHPRLAHMVLSAQARGQGALAAPSPRC